MLPTIITLGLQNRAICKARISTNDANVVKPTIVADIHSSHTHGSNTSRIEMIKGVTKMKARATNSEASGIETKTPIHVFIIFR